ncbi:hypothetical protein ZWY2020_046819 [Hordeum vulgare]|nr:hypothetical protein ZWY2020_046819 [Hordeum vulgare]
MAVIKTSARPASSSGEGLRRRAGEGAAGATRRGRRGRSLRRACWKPSASKPATEAMHLRTGPALLGGRALGASGEAAAAESATSLSGRAEDSTRSPERVSRRSTGSAPTGAMSREKRAAGEVRPAGNGGSDGGAAQYILLS